MRMSQNQITSVPTIIYRADPKRGVFIARNTDPLSKMYVQFGKPGSPADFFPILPGDTFTLDRGDLSQEIWMWADAVNANNYFAVG